MAGDIIEFANPVIGTKEPAPANLPILLNTFIVVKNALRKIKLIETIVPDASNETPLYLQYSEIISPNSTN